MKTHTFHSQAFPAAIEVVPLMQASGDIPYSVTITPEDKSFPTETFSVTTTYPFCAAQEALDRYKERHGISPTEQWAL